MPDTSESEDVDKLLRRRRFLQTTGGVAAAGLVAGCIGGDGDGDGDGDGSGDGSGDGAGDGDGTGDGSGDGSGDGGDDGDDGDGTGGTDYPTDDIRWVIPFSTGGGFDAYSRALAEYMPAHLPNDVDIVPENVPGAGGRTGANEIWRSDPDGYTVGIFNVPGKLATQMVQETEYDLGEISWFGRIANANYVLYTNVDSGLETLEDLQNADTVTFTATGFSGTAGLVALVGSSVLEINAEFITGYEGSSEARLGVIRGDADARMGTWSNLQQPIEDGEVNGVISLTEEPPDWAPDMPTVVDEGYPEAVMGLQRLCGGPPGMDDEVLDVLEQALLDTAESEEMQAWAEDAGRPLAPAGREEVETIIENNVAAFEEYRDLLEERIG